MTTFNLEKNSADLKNLYIFFRQGLTQDQRKLLALALQSDYSNPKNRQTINQVLKDRLAEFIHIHSTLTSDSAKSLLSKFTYSGMTKYLATQINSESINQHISELDGDGNLSFKLWGEAYKLGQVDPASIKVFNEFVKFVSDISETPVNLVAKKILTKFLSKVNIDHLRDSEHVKQVLNEVRLRFNYASVINVNTIQEPKLQEKITKLLTYKGVKAEQIERLLKLATIRSTVDSTTKADVLKHMFTFINNIIGDSIEDSLNSYIFKSLVEKQTPTTALTNFLDLYAFPRITKFLDYVDSKNIIQTPDKFKTYVLSQLLNTIKFNKDKNKEMNLIISQFTDSLFRAFLTTGLSSTDYKKEFNTLALFLNVDKGGDSETYTKLLSYKKALDFYHKNVKDIDSSIMIEIFNIDQNYKHCVDLIDYIETNFTNGVSIKGSIQSIYDKYFPKNTNTSRFTAR